MIPKFMAEIRDVSQHRVQTTHDSDDGVCDIGPLFFGFKSAGVLNELLNVPSVLGNDQFRHLRVVFHLRVFHILVKDWGFEFLNYRLFVIRFIRN